MKLEKIKLTSICPASYNPRKISEEDKLKLRNSIDTFGVVDPIIINLQNNKIIGGHQRYDTLLDKYMEDNSFFEELNLIRLGDVGWVFPDTDLKIPTEDHEKALNLALNKISGEWDTPKLEELLTELDLSGFGIELTGFDELDIGELDLELPSFSNEPSEIVEDDYEVDDDLEVTVELGDIYQLGNHRLMCGDSTHSDDVSLLMNGENADMVFTDPPYGMKLDTDWSNAKSKSKFYQEKGCKGQGNSYSKVIGDNDDFTPKLIDTIFNNFGYCKEIFTWGADYYAEYLPNKNDGSWIVWDKRSNEDTIQEYVEQCDKMFGSCFELCWSKNRHKREIARVKWAGIFGTETEFDRKRVHPTQKPTLLSSWFLNKFSKENDNIVDIYGGSGSTLIACEQLNRNCYMMELDPKYCQVIINRWEEFTGEKATKIN